MTKTQLIAQVKDGSIPAARIQRVLELVERAYSAGVFVTDSEREAMLLGSADTTFEVMDRIDQAGN